MKNITEEADDAPVSEQKKQTAERMKKLPLASLSADAFGAGKTEEFFGAPEWKELSQSCLGCGTCTFVCPTCQCYDIKDFNTGHGVKTLPLLGFLHVFRFHKDVGRSAQTYSA